jgi:NAD(P)-dependent dehydrogenase (short-subunit alcohol dehydrogenase family)
MPTLAKNPIAPTETLHDHFDNQQTYSGMTRYPDSKLAVNAFARHLATTVSSNEVIVNNVCPGMVATGFDRSLPGWIMVPFIFIRKAVARTVEECSRTLIYATAVVGPESHGRFIQNNKVES